MDAYRVRYVLARGALRRKELRVHHDFVRYYGVYRANPATFARQSVHCVFDVRVRIAANPQKKVKAELGGVCGGLLLLSCTRFLSHCITPICVLYVYNRNRTRYIYTPIYVHNTHVNT